MKELWRRKWVWLVVVLLVAVLVVHVMLAIWVRDYLNRKLAELPGYHGHITAVDLHLWRGAYQIQEIKIVKTGGDVPVPFFSAPTLDLSVEWKALLDGSFVGEIYFERPKLNFVHGPTESQTQAGLDQPWTETVKTMFPLRINRFVVHEGEIHYRDFHKNPKVDVILDHFRMVATNLTNSKKISKTLNAHIEMEGRPLQSGNLRSKIDLDPYATSPTFSTQLEMEDVPLVKLNDFAKAYAGITFEAGTLRVATEMDAKKGNFTGYVEPVFEKMEIFSPEHDSKNPIDFIWQGIVGGLTRIVRNQSKDRFGTRVPLSGSFDNPEPAIMQTVINVFKNALIKAFEGKLKNEDLPSVPRDQE